MSTTSRARAHNERNQVILKQLVKEQANKNCADCKVTKNPRWASWNLGLFMCIRCSGIHRSMGTHISRVKSVDLDSWTDEQVNSMVQWGNAKANAFWEASLPEGYIPDDSKMENFIRTKYDLKKWAAAKVMPNPSSIQVSTPEAPCPAPVSAPASAPAPAPIRRTAPTPTPGPSPSVRTGPATGNLLDLSFGSERPLPSLPPSVSVSPASSTLSLPQLSLSRPDLKKSILSLYSTPTSSQTFQRPQPQPMMGLPQTNGLASPPPFPAPSQSQYQFQSPSQSQYQFQSPSQSQHQFQSPSQSQYQFQSQQASQPHSQPASQWTSPIPTPSANSNNLKMDDDLFKNVWS